jgi:hypothetical protein
MKKTSMMALLFATVLLAVVPVQAKDKPIQLGLFTPVQIFSEKESISGLRFSLIYGSNVNMTGLDVGLVTKTSDTFKGYEYGLVGIVDGNGTGLQVNLVSLTQGAFSGVQSGFYNSANRAEGFQFGIINSAGTMNGLQIGLLNFIHEGGWMRFFPIINGSF